MTNDAFVDLFGGPHLVIWASGRKFYALGSPSGPDVIHSPSHGRMIPRNGGGGVLVDAVLI